MGNVWMGCADVRWSARLLLCAVLMSCLLLAACGRNAEPAPEPEEDAAVVPTATVVQIEIPPTATPLPQPTDTPVPTPTNTPDPTTDVVSLRALDDVTLEGTYYRVVDVETSVPALLLLHSSYQDRERWHEFAKYLQSIGYAILTVDFRGHGGSEGEKAFTPLMDGDVDVALQWLRSQPGIDGQRIGVMGSSVGGNLALRAAVRNEWIRAVAMLSPGLEMWELPSVEVLDSYGNRPLMLVAAEDDEYHAESAKYLAENSAGYHQIKLYDGESHGTDMLIEHEDLSLRIVNFFQSTLIRTSS